jgi:hypothetical protein
MTHYLFEVYFIQASPDDFITVKEGLAADLKP